MLNFVNLNNQIDIQITKQIQ